ncbi:TIGR03621 family F420-dependent LLM class oxidoreductase [Kutzneria albida]|uniref:TIGR03621 family F420-dependent LLM class oxidoreductase n=1 Tax=Kutzneria albida TaxID=43357 RepID=UPI00046CF42A|nr:TIGR03621 family F420-dependent LLM class oxidoreductase [Kutzneria albida]
MDTSRAPLRFGVVLISEGCGRAEWVAKCRRAEELGYDVVAAPDHVNLTSPFPSVVLAAEATERPRIGTYVLNASFHNPRLLARDIATMDQFLDGRLEIGLGTGYVQWEFEDAGVPFGSPGSRVDRLEHAVVELDRLLTDPELPKSVQRPRPPLLVGGHGNRVLRLAAQRAEVVSFVGAQFDPKYGRMTIATAEQMRERVRFVRAAAGERADQLEFNVLSKATLLTKDRAAAVEQLRRFGPELSEEDLLGAPVIGVGTAADIAEKVRENNEVYGISYTTVMENAMESFGKVIELLR